MLTSHYIVRRPPPPVSLRTRKRKAGSITSGKNTVNPQAYIRFPYTEGFICTRCAAGSYLRGTRKQLTLLFTGHFLRHNKNYRC